MVSKILLEWQEMAFGGAPAKQKWLLWGPAVSTTSLISL